MQGSNHDENRLTFVLLGFTLLGIAAKSHHYMHIGSQLRHDCCGVVEKREPYSIHVCKRRFEMAFRSEAAFRRENGDVRREGGT